MSSVEAEILAVSKEFEDAYNSGDAKKTAAYYSEDCTLCPSGMEEVKGRESVEEVFSSVMKAGATKLKVLVDKIGKVDLDGIVYDMSHYTFYMADGSVYDYGTYLCLWKKEADRWKAYIDTLSSSKSK